MGNLIWNWLWNTHFYYFCCFTTANMITHFNVAQMLVQHRLKTDPNLENQLRAASAVVRSYSSRRIIRWVCERSRGLLSSRGGAKCAAAGGAEPHQIAGYYYYWDFDDNNNKHFSRYLVRNGSGTQKLRDIQAQKPGFFEIMKLFFFIFFGIISSLNNKSHIDCCFSSAFLAE